MRRTSCVLAGAACAFLWAHDLHAASPPAGEARVAALQARLQALEAEAAQVEAIVQVQRLGRAFGYYIDKGYFGEAADLFADDASFQWGNDGVYVGKARIRELLVRHGGGSLKEGPGLPFGRLNLRMQLQPVVTVAPDGLTARARWREWGLLGQYKSWAGWSDAVIEDRYVFDRGVWKISERRYFLNFEAPYQGGWMALKASDSLKPSAVAAEFPPDAPPATPAPRFPAVFVPPYHYAAGSPSALRSPTPPLPPQRPDDALGRLEARADARALQLARARSVRAIENLQGMYGYYIDKGLWTQAAALFSRDGSHEYGQSGVYVGPASIARGLSLMGPPGLQPGQLNNHVTVQPIIHVAADNRTAKARWRADVLQARGSEGRWGGGVYENEYVNDNGTWKISRLHYHVTFWGDYEQGWAAKPLPMEPPSTTLPPDRPPTVVYESFPALQVVPFHYANPVSGKPHAGE